MSGVRRTEEDPAPVPAAVRWFARLREEQGSDLPARDLAEWEQWTTNPPHVQQLAEVKTLWQALGTLPCPRKPTEAELSADQYDGSLPIERWLKTRRAFGRKPATRFGQLIALAACLAILVVGLSQHWRTKLWQYTFADPSHTYITAQGETRLIMLPDRSEITLGARTELSTHYTATRRVIVLERGEAWFSVSHDPGRPFIVLAGGGAITAVGTQFNVRRDLDVSFDRVTVVVSNGIVDVSPRNTSAPSDRIERSTTLETATWHPARLAQGQEVTYDMHGERGDVQRADLEAAAAWKEGRLEYHHQALRLVIPQVNRYSVKPIVLADSAAGQIEFSGTVFQGQVDEWVRALATAFPIEVSETDKQIVIRTRGDTAVEQPLSEK